MTCVIVFMQVKLKLPVLTTMQCRCVGDWRYNSIHSQFRSYIEVTGNPHTSIALYSRIKALSKH